MCVCVCVCVCMSVCASVCVCRPMCACGVFCVCCLLGMTTSFSMLTFRLRQQEEVLGVAPLRAHIGKKSRTQCTQLGHLCHTQAERRLSGGHYVMLSTESKHQMEGPASEGQPLTACLRACCVLPVRPTQGFSPAWRCYSLLQPGSKALLSPAHSPLPAPHYLNPLPPPTPPRPSTCLFCPMAAAGTTLVIHRLSAVFGASAVALGAYGAHGFKPKDDHYMEVFKRANHYHLLHALLLAVAPLSRKPTIVAGLTSVGILIFSGR